VSRRERERAGRRAETVAAWWLRAKGFGIVATRYRTRVGEIDLVARRGRLVVFVEVKRRHDADAAAASVTGRQRQRILRAAEQFLAAQRLQDVDIRFDVVLVAPGRLPLHIAGAFDATA
jgi:putative endonuclease